MSNSDVLSKDEVDTLLDKTKNEQGNAAHASKNVMDFHLGESINKTIDGIVKFEIINEVFCKESAIATTHFLCQKCLIESQTPETVNMNEFISSLSRPVLINYVNIKPLGGLMLTVFTNQLVSNLIEVLFGGRVQDEVSNEREFGSLEMRIGKLFMDIINQSLTPAWDILKSDLEFQYVKSLINPSLVKIVPGKENLIMTKCSLIIGQVANEFYLCYPNSTLEPIKDLFKNDADSSQNNEARIWTQTLTRNFSNVPLSLDASNMEVPITLNELMHLEVGDIIPIKNPNYAQITIDGTQAFTGKCTNHNGKRAIVIENRHLD